jgi:hypothetical protein
VRHSEDDAREARYKHRTWRKSNGDFYVGTEPPHGAKAEGIVSLVFDTMKSFLIHCSTIPVPQLLVDVLCTMGVSTRSIHDDLQTS